ncbi:hypothetical protein JXA40_05270 [bacterium]|nr:hypothetical protein [candidate division CSSED10-310 bacterium]
MKRNLVWSALLCAIFMASPATAHPLDWDSPVVLHWDATYTMDLRGGPDGLFHMLFSQDDIHAFYYFRYDGSAYSQLVQSFPETGTMLCSLDFWGNLPVVVYRYKIDRNMEFCIRTGTWTTPDEIPDTIGAHAVCTDIEPSGVIHIAWVYRSDVDDSLLMHSYSVPGGWDTFHVFTIGEHTLVNTISMKLDPEMVPHFAWFDRTAEVIGYAVQTGIGEYDADIVDSADSCRWIELDFINSDLPFIGYLKGSSASVATLHYALRFGGSFSGGMVLHAVGIYEADMAIAREDSITSSRTYFLVVLSGGAYYLYNEAGEWMMDRIDALYSISTNVNLSADWCSETDTVGMAVSEFSEDEIYFVTAHPVTPTPAPTDLPTRTPTAGPGTPTATPNSCDTLGCTIDMPSTEFHPGDPCHCRVILCNPGPKTYVDIPLFVILDVYGTLFFAPSFGDFDHYTFMFPAGVMTREILPEFAWPEGAGSASGINFYAGMTDREMTVLLGEYDVFTFGWSE